MSVYQLPAALLAQLSPELRAIASRPHTLGYQPFRVRVGAAGALVQSGIALGDGGATGYTDSTVTPTGIGADQHVRWRRRSGPSAGNTAGLFGLPSALNLSSAAGWCAAWISAGALAAPENRGGDLIGENFAADASFEPNRVVNGRGWVKASGAASIWVWYDGTPGVTVACTGSAPCNDDRRYLHLMGTAAGSGVLHAAKVDLRNLVIADQRVTSAPAVLTGFELNRSARASGSGGTVDLEMESMHGSRGVRSFS